MYYCTRPSAAATRSPNVCRAVRNASFFPTTSFYHSRPAASPTSIANDIAPFLRLIDEFTAPLAPAFAQHARRQIPNIFGIPGQVNASIPSFTPRFDVREVEGAYEVRGDVPGFESKKIEVEFTGAQTLVIRGRTESQQSASSLTDAVNNEGEAATASSTIAFEAAAVEAKSAAESDKGIVDDNASTYSTGSYQKPTVEETEPEAVYDGVAVDAQGAAESLSDAAMRASNTVNEDAAVTKSRQEHVQATAQQQEQARYWHRERTFGSFQRVFKFEERVDQEGVSAELKNGVLSIMVPKAAAPVVRRIVVQ